MYRPDGAKIKKLRLEQRLTPYKLAVVSKVHVRTIKFWEGKNDGADFGFNSLAKVASALTVPYTELIEYVPEPDSE